MILEHSRGAGIAVAGLKALFFAPFLLLLAGLKGAAELQELE